MAGSFGEVIDNKRIIVCVGSGGVGKTTTAATFAIEAARRGKRALVLTIDPAKRLANSLGMTELGNTEAEVSPERSSRSRSGSWSNVWAPWHRPSSPTGVEVWPSPS